MDSVSPAPAILAIVYSDGIAADRVLADVGYRLRDSGVAITGLVQHNHCVRERVRCDMEVEELASRIVLQLAEDRGDGATGCRLDPAALMEAAALITASLNNGPELLIINKFGKCEAEGGGLRAPLTEAFERGIPAIIGVPYRNIEQWRAFTECLAEESAINPARLRRWLARQGFDLGPEVAGSKPMASPNV
jgi:hypothetical protein